MSDEMESLAREAKATRTFLDERTRPGGGGVTRPQQSVHSAEHLGPEVGPDGTVLRPPTNYELSNREKAGIVTGPNIPATDVSGEPTNMWSEAQQRWLGQGEFKYSHSKRRRCVEITPKGYRCPWPTTEPTDFCWRHGGNRYAARMLSERRYESLLGDPAMRDMFVGFLEDPDITDCRGELALQRSLLGGVLAQISDAGISLENLKSESVMALTGLNAAVVKLAESVDRINNKAAATVSVTQAMWFVNQIVEHFWDAMQVEVFGDQTWRVAPNPDGSPGVWEGETDAADRRADDGTVTRPGATVRDRLLTRLALALETVVAPVSRKCPSAQGLIAVVPRGPVDKNWPRTGETG